MTPDREQLLIPSLLAGKIAVLSQFGLEVEREYSNILGLGNYELARRVYHYNHMEGKYASKLMFLNEPPMRKDGVVFYCLKEVGVNAPDDWYWFSLDQLIIIENEMKS